MKKLLFIGFFVLFLLGCEENDKVEYRPFLIYVDSIAIPNTIVATNLFDIEFYGLVGINSCSEFSHFETDKSGNEISIECWGKESSVTAPCLDVLISLEDEKLSYLIEESGNYLIRIKQPDNSFIERELVVQ